MGRGALQKRSYALLMYDLYFDQMRIIFVIG